MFEGFGLEVEEFSAVSGRKAPRPLWKTSEKPPMMVEYLKSRMWEKEDVEEDEDEELMEVEWW